MMIRVFAFILVTWSAMAQPAPPYRLAEGDTIRVLVWKEPSLTQQASVDREGMVVVPKLGAVRAAGFTADRLAKSIEERLRAEKVLEQPIVAVETVRVSGGK